MMRLKHWQMGGALAVALAAMSPRDLSAQQYITDDALITEYRACQIQMWHGERASWVLPVCTPIRDIELSLGFIALWDDGTGDGHFEYTVQAKMKLVHRKRFKTGFVIGTGRDPALAGPDHDSRSFYAYVPVTTPLFGERVILHNNVGWLYHDVDDGTGTSGAHALTWASRADVSVGSTRFPLFAVIEIYGAEGDAAAAPEFQVGLRTNPRRESVQLDLSWGGHLRTGSRAAGWTIGLTLVTPPFL